MDLNDPHNTGKSRNLRFVNRVFTPGEQELIFDSAKPDTMAWALWAGKETAYKIINKCYPSASSVPRLYTVHLDQRDETSNSGDFPAAGSTATGSVDTPYGNVHIKIFITSDYVHCIGTTSSLENIESLIWHVDRISPDSELISDYESLFVRKALKRRLLAYCNRDAKDIDIRREKGPHGLGPPFVCINGTPAEIDISLSHDGVFTAYAFVENDARTMDVNPESVPLKIDLQ
ncbi:MAG: 4'-phosphopantetheinyl transferase superfamily protein [Syntrophaceae bacterium]